MADIAKLPAEHRGTARRVPEKHRQRMTDAELAYRAKHVSQLEDKAPHGEPGNASRRYAAALLRAMPLREFIDKYRHLGEVAHGVSSSDAAFDFRQAQNQLREENPYPHGLREAAERRLAGKDGMHTELSNDELDSMLGREPVTKAKSELERKQAELLAEIRAYKARLGIS